MAVTGKAREVLAKVRSGAAEGRRSLPVRGDAAEIRRAWDDPARREAILEGAPAGEATLDVGAADRDWGLVVTLTLRLESPLPGMEAQALAGKAVRRLKALVETGEIPTTAHNPSARDDAGEAPS